MSIFYPNKIRALDQYLPNRVRSLFHSIKSRIYFILQLGYFKSHHMFFVFDLPDVEEDAWYIQRRYFPDVQLDNLDITKVTRLRQQGVLLRLCNYRSCDAAQRQALAAKA